LEDHRRHTRDLTNILLRHHEKAPTGPDFKRFVTQGKVLIGQVQGDVGILKAMLSNEGETNTAYERMFLREDHWEDSKEIIRQGFEDEKKHALWIQKTLESL